MLRTLNGLEEASIREGLRLCQHRARVGPLCAYDEIATALNYGVMEVIMDVVRDSSTSLLALPIPTPSAVLPPDAPVEKDWTPRIVARIAVDLSHSPDREVESIKTFLAANTGIRHLAIACASSSTAAPDAALAFSHRLNTSGLPKTVKTMTLELEGGGGAISSDKIGTAHRSTKDRGVDIAMMPTDGEDVSQFFISCITKTEGEDQKLFPTIVTDESQIALGFVYSNADSIAASIREGRGIYWSRSRGELWRKGDTSGAIQELVSLSLDCDSDAIRFVVRQLGSPPAFCHKETRTCWGEDAGLHNLFRVIEERRRTAEPGWVTDVLWVCVTVSFVEN